MNLWQKYKYLQDIVLLIIFHFRQAHFAFLHSSCLQLDWDVFWKLFWVSVPVSEIFGYDVRFFPSTVMLVMTWSLSVSWMGWSPPYAIQWTTFDKSLKPEILILLASRVACDVMVSMVMVSMKPLCAICGDQSSGKHFDAFVCEGCKAFFRLRKPLNKIIEECLMLIKKISSKSLCSSSFQADGQKESWWQVQVPKEQWV